MGSLRADALRVQGAFIERRRASIGTLRSPSQGKVTRALLLGSLLACWASAPRLARAATGDATPGRPAPESPLPNPRGPASAAPSTPTPTTADQGGAPLPSAPPPAQGAAGANALSPPPAARGFSAPPPPGSDLPALPPPPRGSRYHDGFYLRMALGLGVSGALVSSEANSVPNYSFAGGGGAADLWLGGTPAKGLAMGGALSVLAMNSTRRRVDGASRSGDVSGTTGLLGFFVDGFPDPQRGFHFGGAVGLASGHAEVKNSDPDTFNGSGVGLGTWLGYDAWVSPQWSLGGLLRLTGSLTRETRDDVSYQASLGGATLSFTALYH
jgi:hypothetical protein